MGILEASMIRRIVRPFFASVRKIGTLVIADNANSTSPNGTLSAISAAQHLKLPVTVLICGGEKIANERAQICSRAPGVSRVLVAKGQAYENCFPEEIDQLAASLVRENNYRYIVLNHSSYGRELSPRIAALLGINQASDAMELSEVNCVRGTFAGNALTRVNIKGAKLVITIRQSSFNPVTGSGSAPIEPLHAAEAISTRKELLSDGVNSQGTPSPDLASAKVVVCGGRAFGTKEKFQLVHQLAEKLNAAVASTRAAVDSKIAPSDTQVGQTGKTVAPTLYIALGVSGAVQHLSGMSNSRVIVSVNSDAEAPIFSSSDYGLVKDIFEVVPELIRRLPAGG